MHAAFWNKPMDGLKKNNDPQFNPYWGNFVEVKWPVFLAKWRHILSESQIEAATQIANNFTEIQDSLSRANLTLCHGDVKSANIFYKITENKEPVFIDWQYIVYGKGVQDLVFFMIESFDKDTIRQYRDLFKEHYYTRLCENGVVYDRSEYETDFKNAIHYFPFFVAMWFGTISEDELIDKSFPREFIQKLFSFISNN
jgi:thiamine kinase-like enzyme